MNLLLISLLGYCSSNAPLHYLHLVMSPSYSYRYLWLMTKSVVSLRKLILIILLSSLGSSWRSWTFLMSWWSMLMTWRDQWIFLFVHMHKWLWREGWQVCMIRFFICFCSRVRIWKHDLALLLSWRCLTWSYWGLLDSFWFFFFVLHFLLKFL